MASTSTTATTTDNTAYNIGIIKQFSAMKVTYYGTANGTSSFNMTLSYKVVAVQGAVHQVNFTFTAVTDSGETSTDIVAWVDTDKGVVTQVQEGGYTLPESVAGQIFDGVMSPFTVQQTFGSSYLAFTNTAYFHSTGTQTKSFGPTSFQVTDYVANTLPQTFSTCESTYSMTAFNMEVGTPPGASGPFFTLLHLAGTVTYHGSQIQEDFTFKLISLTVA